MNIFPFDNGIAVSPSKRRYLCNQPRRHRAIFQMNFHSRTDCLATRKSTYNMKSDCSAKCQPMQKNRTNIFFAGCLLIFHTYTRGPGSCECRAVCSYDTLWRTQKVIQSSAEPLQHERKYFVTIAST